jgi:two-component sensor histidine kinase
MSYPMGERMMNKNEPLVEPPGSGEKVEVTLLALEQRIRQQEILAELGVCALRGPSFDQLLEDTVRLTADGLRTVFCKVLEHDPSQHRFLVRAGVGWGEGVVGVATVGDDLESPAGYALRTKSPVISNHLEHEERFRTPEMLQRFGIRRAMNVILQGDGRPYGVLEVDSQSEDEFGKADLAFLQGAANLLGMAIERDRHERSLAAALEHQKALLKEMNHRIRNSLTIVGSMLRLQARKVADQLLSAQLKEAADRIGAVARAHELLYQGSDLDRLDIGKYIERICKDFDSSISHCTINVSADYGIEIPTDKAISCALIVNELVSNAAKYAYPGGGGEIWVTLAQTAENGFTLSVRDEGVGIAQNFDVAKSKGLGMRLVAAFTQQLGGALDIHSASPGIEFEVKVPSDHLHSGLVG